MPGILAHQVRLLRTLSSKTFPDDATYRAWLAETFPQAHWGDPARPSTLDLGPREADRAIKLLKGEARPQPREPWRGVYQCAGRRGAAAHLTQAQGDEIARHEHRLGWLGQPERLQGFILRQLGKRKAVPMLTLAEATTILNGLKKL